MERGWLACALRRFSWQIKGRAAVQRKASSAQVRRLTATGQERLLERVLIPAPTSSYAYRGEPTYLCKRCIFYLAACRAVSEVSSHKDRCALRW